MPPQLDFFPPWRPAARFWDFEPPLPLPLFLPPLLEAPGELAIDAARCLLIPFLRRPSYCLSFLTLEPWSLAIECILLMGQGTPDPARLPLPRYPVLQARTH